VRRTTLSALVLVLALALAAPVSAGNPFARSSSTEDGHHTWDSDMIDLEGVTETGAGVYVAVLDTGLVNNWTDYFPKARVRTDLGMGFYQPVNFKADKSDPCGLVGQTGALRQTNWTSARGSTHGTHVASTVIGYNYYSNHDAASGFPLPPIQVRGIAPNATIIPVKVLADYQVPALPKCTDPGPRPATLEVFGTDEMVAAGINYVAELAEGGLGPIVINMSLGGDVLDDVEKDAIDRAIAAGVIVVASAGNEGEDGMSFPGAYPPVISVGAAGWTGEWLDDGASGKPPANEFRYRMWWLKDKEDGALTPPLFDDSGDVADPTDTDHVYVTDFSSRELDGQELDVLAPGSWVRGPFPGFPGRNRMPWFSRGISDLVGAPTSNFFYVGGTSMAAPHVSGLAAMMLEKDGSLEQDDVESILKSTALDIPAGSAQVWDPFYEERDEDGTLIDDTPQFVEMSWDEDATGAGLIRADMALDAIP
jgi:subtilisin family serine protease